MRRCIYSSFPTSFNLQSFFQCTVSDTSPPLFDPNTAYTVYGKHSITMTCPSGSKVKDSCSDKVSAQSIQMCHCKNCQFKLINNCWLTRKRKRLRNKKKEEGARQTLLSLRVHLCRIDVTWLCCWAVFCQVWRRWNSFYVQKRWNSFCENLCTGHRAKL